ncbi:MAG: hypothetical protein J6T10_24445 [Methanobrevibacter sp.]|nr:hypothetical protein [Methanobrevibacter sp.]
MMINAEKYLKDSVAITEFVIAFRKWYYGEERIIRTADKDIENFLREKVQFTLTEDERVILRNMPKDYETIGKCVNGVLYVTTDRKIYLDKAFGGFFNHLFQFIKEGEEYEISELLGDEKL